ncbi:hypothetical protein [Altibacter sp. HG106]|uniref:hypothetical protein n=1 Tax=Altibacter sp. HG106 TaxID=3023937 RepID=UPI002350FA64|nr:hypothetical protein [Altibacter sp. HG106]MDC7995026.1 hypothetical protein [Altibacter sp. HG106]
MESSVRFLGLMAAVLLVVFGLHLAILYAMDFPLFSDEIVLSYVVNYALAALIFLIIQRTLGSKASYAGFIFMLGSGLKFLLFFLVFYPKYQADEVMETSEFTAFFVPYGTCLILEVYYLAKQLNNQSSESAQSPQKKQ